MPLGHAPPLPQARELVVVPGRSAPHHLVVERLGGGKEPPGAAGERGLAGCESPLALGQLSLERAQRLELVPLRLRLPDLDLDQLGDRLVRRRSRFCGELELGGVEAEVGAEARAEIR